MLSESLECLFATKDSYCTNNFVIGEEGKKLLTERRVLVIGAGGLGCELLKSLAMSGIKHIEIIDMDTIDVSNLNRQFLFRQKDVGRYKSEVAAEFVKRRVPDCEIIAHTCKIQEKPTEWYQTFDIVIGGLDNVNARIWMNNKAVDIAIDNNQIIPYIDGGSEGWKGHCRFVKPLETSCMSCVDSFPAQKVFQFCTIATNPRQPEHCVAWVMDVLWPKERPNEKLDGDNDEHLEYVVKNANIHAKKFNLGEVTPFMARGVIKGIIPAIASTQAYVASVCTTEAIKYLTGMAPNGSNIQMSGNNGTNVINISINRVETCPVCSRKPIPTFEIESTATIQDLIDSITKKLDIPNPRLIAGSSIVYNPLLFPDSRNNLPKPLTDFYKDGDEIGIPNHDVILTIKLI